MKKTIFAFITFSTITFNVNAGTNLVNCNSIIGTNRNVILVVVDNVLRQIRVQPNSSHPQAFFPHKVTNSNIDGVSIYTVRGMIGFLQVENQILEGNPGLIKLANDELTCF